MKNIFLNTTEGNLKTKDGEELAFRVYSTTYELFYIELLE